MLGLSVHPHGVADSLVVATLPYFLSLHSTTGLRFAYRDADAVTDAPAETAEPGLW